MSAMCTLFFANTNLKNRHMSLTFPSNALKRMRSVCLFWTNTLIQVNIRPKHIEPIATEERTLVINEREAWHSSEKGDRISPEAYAIAYKALGYGTLLGFLLAFLSARLLMWFTGFSSADEVLQFIRDKPSRHSKRLKEQGITEIVKELSLSSLLSNPKELVEMIESLSNADEK